jgi:hypothetical protein
MGNLRDKYTNEEWDALVEESNKRKDIIEPTKYALTKEELLGLINFVKVYGSYSTPDKVLDDYMQRLLPENQAKLGAKLVEDYYKTMDKEVHFNRGNLNK